MVSGSFLEKRRARVVRAPFFIWSHNFFKGDKMTKSKPLRTFYFVTEIAFGW